MDGTKLPLDSDDAMVAFVLEACKCRHCGKSLRGGYATEVKDGFDWYCPHCGKVTEYA